MSVALLGIPSDAHSSYLRGAAGAPALVRAELWSEAGNPYTELGVNLRVAALQDAGDVAIADDTADNERIEAAARIRLLRGERVLSIGGDHSVTYPLVRAYAAMFEALTVVHFDAHPDLYPVFGGDRYSHACPFARILEDCPNVRLVQIGIRTMSPPQAALAERYSVRVFAPWQLDEAANALPDGDVYVTLDMDALDPAYAPGVSHREPGGLSVREVLELVKRIPGRIRGADVVEYNPAVDINGVTASVAAKFVRELAGRILTDAAND